MNDANVQFGRRARKLAFTWVMLIALLLSSAGTAYVHLGKWNSALSLGIAVIKAGIVLWLFMGLARAGALIRLVAAGSVITLAIFFVLSEVDYADRNDQLTTPEQPRQLRSVRPDEPLH